MQDNGPKPIGSENPAPFLLESVKDLRMGEPKGVLLSAGDHAQAGMYFSKERFGARSFAPVMGDKEDIALEIRPLQRQ